jgi:cytochrome b6-f complex iron-sulfur subunit
MTAGLSRREFLSLAGAALGAAASGCAGVPVLQPLVDEGRISISLDELTTTGGTNQAVLVDAPQRKYPVIVTYQHGKPRAFSSRCTHQGCRVQPNKGFLVCTCHGSSFTLEGEVVRGPASSPLEELPARLEGGRIYVEVGA